MPIILSVATLSDLVEELIKTLPILLRWIGDDPEVATAAAVTAWKRAAGDGLRQHAVPTALREGTLVVAVADAVWQKQLGAMKDQLIFKTNSILGQALVKRIELVVDRTRVNPQSLNTNIEKTETEIHIELLSAANAISDKHLRQTFVRAATRALDRRQRSQR